MQTLTVLTIAAMLSACTHHRKLGDMADVAGHDVYVTSTTDGLEERGQVLRSPDGSGYAVYTPRGVLYPGNVKKVVRVRHSIGALEGLGLGFGAGALAGAVIGFADGDDVCDSSRGEDFCYYDNTAGEKAVLLGVVFGALGGLIGVAVGGLRGSRYVYEF
jgi:hypothetical protein